MFCAISGQVPQDPVFLAETGLVYEKHLLLKKLEEAPGVCPVTGNAIAETDLMAIKANPAVTPRPPKATSITNMLQLFQGEWDAVLLETHALKKQLYQTQQQLSQSLYQNDAANRVIARLLKERDELKNELSKAGTTAGRSPAPTSVPAPAEAVESALPKAAIDKYAAHHQTVAPTRRKRLNPDGFVDEVGIKENMVELGRYTPHSASKKGIRCVTVHPDTSEILTGGNDGQAKIFSLETKKVVGVIRGHTKPVTGACFLENDMVATSSLDKTIRLWNKSSKKNQYTSGGKMTHHAGPVNSLVAHPVGGFVAAASDDNTWSFCDVNEATAIFQSSEHDEGVRAASVHPDGLLLGFGMGKLISLWDVRAPMSSASVTLEGAQGQVNCISFSEKGFQLASGGDDGVVKVWDLRKKNKGLSGEIASLKMGDSTSPIRSVNFDYSGNYVVATGDDVRVWKMKSWENPLNVFRDSDRASVNGAAFSKNAAILATVADDRNMVIYGIDI